MKNKELLIEKITEGAEIKIDLKENTNRELGSLSKLATLKFGCSPKDFNYVRDMLYFVEGVPDPESKSKLSVLLERFIVICKFYKKLGIESKIEKVLANYGIKLEIDPANFIQNPKGTSDFKFDEMWNNKYHNNDYTSMTNSEILNFLFKQSLDVKKGGEVLKSELKDDICGEVSAKCEVSTGAFLKGVGLKARKLSQGDISDTISDIESRAFELEQILDIL